MVSSPKCFRNEVGQLVAFRHRWHLFRSSVASPEAHTLFVYSLVYEQPTTSFISTNCINQTTLWTITRSKNTTKLGPHSSRVGAQYPVFPTRCMESSYHDHITVRQTVHRECCHVSAATPFLGTANFQFVFYIVIYVTAIASVRSNPGFDSSTFTLLLSAFMESGCGLISTTYPSFFIEHCSVT